jgi:hypothetical protein
MAELVVHELARVGFLVQIRDARLVAGDAGRRDLNETRRPRYKRRSAKYGQRRFKRMRVGEDGWEGNKDRRRGIGLAGMEELYAGEDAK